ncbi:Tn3 family transposase [Streptomyces sp. NPDC056519]|uniref:Tn3 family transposase n=1 Tax=Streptomyces sp. NPDC056519 TaxID=3345849 RepID=UPI003687778B
MSPPPATAASTNCSAPPRAPRSTEADPPPLTRPDAGHPLRQTGHRLLPDAPAPPEQPDPQNQIYRLSARSDAPHAPPHYCVTSGIRLREQIRKATNKAEAYNGLTKWLPHGNADWLASRDPELQHKAVKFLDLLASSIIFTTAIDMTCTLNQMSNEGRTPRTGDLASAPTGARTSCSSPTTPPDPLHIPPAAYDPVLQAAEDLSCG